MNYSRKIGGINLIARCSPSLESQAKGLLAKLSDLNEQGPALKVGTAVKFGWSLLTLLGNEQELIICEPDYEGNPLLDNQPQVEHTLRILAEQVAFLNRIKANPVTTYYVDKVVIAKDILKTERIYLERTETKAPNDSGWYIGEVEGGKKETSVEDLDAIHVFQIFQTRPALMKVLGLAPGYLVIYSGDTIEAIFDESGREVWLT